MSSQSEVLHAGPSQNLCFEVLGVAISENSALLEVIVCIKLPVLFLFGQLFSPSDILGLHVPP